MPEITSDLTTAHHSLLPQLSGKLRTWRGVGGEGKCWGEAGGIGWIGSSLLKKIILSSNLQKSISRFAFAHNGHSQSL